MPTRSAAACLLAFLLVDPAAAGPIPAWSYRNPENIISFPPGASGGFSFPNTPFTSGPGDATFRATQVVSASVAADADPDRVSELPYRFAIELRDDPSGESETLFFEGAFTGSIWRTGSDVRNRFAGPTARSVELGGTTYTLSLIGFDPPDGTGESLAGEITARVTVGGVKEPVPEPLPDPEPLPGPVATPEPTTALLALIGLPVVAAVRAARRRRPTAG